MYITNGFWNFPDSGAGLKEATMGYAFAMINFIRNREIFDLVISYDELIAQPRQELERICDVVSSTYNRVLYQKF